MVKLGDTCKETAVLGVLSAWAANCRINATVVAARLESEGLQSFTQILFAAHDALLVASTLGLQICLTRRRCKE